MKRPLAQNQIKTVLWLGLLLLIACPVSVPGQLFVPVPNSLYTVEGNTNSDYPFLPGFTVRYQQVYDASQFLVGLGFTNLYAPVASGGWITDLFFRADGYTCPFSETRSNVEIHLSTTSRPPDGLSTVFSENVGSDDKLVFSGSFSVGSFSCSLAPEPFFQDHVPLSNFWYNPNGGNLLLDVRVYNDVGGYPFDAASTFGDSISSVYAPSVTAMSGSPDTKGLVTFFSIAPIPALVAYTTTNYIAIRWPTVPTGFVLQQSTSPGSNAFWQSLPGVGGTNPIFQEYRVQLNSLSPSAFFRLTGRAQ